eukprot:10229799-Lingulodinium_polyedra.AAC.1
MAHANSSNTRRAARVLPVEEKSKFSFPSVLVPSLGRCLIGNLRKRSARGTRVECCRCAAKPISRSTPGCADQTIRR